MPGPFTSVPLGISLAITLWPEERQMLNVQVLNSVQLLPLNRSLDFFQRLSTDLFVRGKTDEAWFFSCVCVVYLSDA